MEGSEKKKRQKALVVMVHMVLVTLTMLMMFIAKAAPMVKSMVIDLICIIASFHAFFWRHEPDLRARNLNQMAMRLQ